MRTKAPNVDHAYLRAAQRCGWSKPKARKMMREASLYGKSFDHIDDPEISEFVRVRQVCTRRRIRYYKGYIFVFASTSTRCYTVYKYGENDGNEEN